MRRASATEDSTTAAGRAPSLVRRRWFRWTLIVTLFVSASCVGGILLQRRLIYPAPRFRAPDTRGATLLRLPLTSGETVHALYYAAPVAEAPVIVYFHGNGEQLASVVSLARRLVALGVGVLAVEYPGYGLSRRASPNEKGLYRHAEKAIRHLLGPLGVARRRVVLAGWSLGTGVAAEMARRGLGSRLVLLSPFTTMPALVRHLFPALPSNQLILDVYDTLAKAPTIGIPTLVVHGARDRLIPLEMGRRVAQALKKAKLVVIPGAGHNDLYARGGVDLLRRIVRFARE